MIRRRHLLVLAAALVVLGVVWEGLRDRPPAVEPIERGTPLREGETSRMEGGVLLRFTRGSEPVLELNATSMAQLEGGAHFVRDVLELRAFMADGRFVSLSARSGTVSTSGSRGEQVAVVLEGDVRVRDPEGYRLETDELRYDTNSKKVTGPGPAWLRGPGFDARVESFEYRPDERVIETRGALEAHLEAEVPWRIDAARALYRLGPGELVFPGAFRARQPDRSLLGARGVVRPARDDRPLQFEGTGPVVVSGPGRGVAWQLAAGELEALRPAGAPGSATALAGTSIAASSRGSRAGSGSLGAPRWMLEPDASHPGDLVALAPEGFVGRWAGADGSRWTARGRELRLRKSAGRGLSRLEASGDVRLEGGPEVRVFGERLAWDADRPSQVRVEGDGARAMRGQDLVEAPVLRYLRDRRLLVGEGGAITEIAPAGPAGDGLFRGDEPVRVRSESVSIPLDEGPIEFRGPVQAWQFDTVLRARRMRWEAGERKLVADGDVVGRFVVGRRSEKARTLRASARHLAWVSAERRARLEGDARFEDADLRLSAARIDISVDERGEVERLEAVEDVRLERADDVGRADRLNWIGGRLGVLSLIGEKQLARLLPAHQTREVRASVIRYHLASRQYETEGGGGRSVITDRPPENDDDGKP